ncbi:jg13906 [Pararge aegeria aegeria]|uniref:Jg13906 protein n=1 Tax=Pararge aegeria aegeria TaxID=348720 RepID=A0A8S4SH72_9NEOP|nr:jg13906 [Pararge aegeria aegeria]
MGRAHSSEKGWTLGSHGAGMAALNWNPLNILDFADSEAGAHMGTANQKAIAGIRKTGFIQRAQINNTRSAYLSCGM